jgi:hypothetical protein
LQRWQDAAEAAADDDGYVRSHFDHIAVITPYDEDCGYAGIAWVRRRGTRINGEFMDDPSIMPRARGVIEHELGHNLGNYHAGTLACGNKSLATSCTRVDYGDHMDVMGRSFYRRHFNAFHKNLVGWLPSSNVRTVSSGTQTIDLTASEQPVAGATQLIVIPRANGTKLAIERRASFGQYDQGMSGVWVRLVGAPGGSMGTDDTQLLDMTPNSDANETNDFYDGNLAAGQTFTDSTNDITVRTLSDSAGSSTAQIQVCIGTCGSSGSTTTSTSSTSTTSTTVPAGSSITASVVNKELIVTGTNAADAITVTRKSSKLLVTANRPLALGSSCSGVVDGVATCKATRTSVNGGAGDDTLTIAGSPKATVTGGPGDDWIVGGKSRDVFIGSAGDDTVDYSARVGQKITGTPGTGPDDGKRGERDDIQADVEHVMFPPPERR